MSWSGGSAPRPLGFIALSQKQEKGSRRRDLSATSPLSLGRRGARVASRQRPILRGGVLRIASRSVDGKREGLSRHPGVEDLEGGLEVETFAGPVIDPADIAG